MNAARILLGILPLLSLPAQAGETRLSDFAGVWRGTGTYERLTTTVASGRLTCRLTITAASDDDITVDGRCAAPEGSQGFRTRITASGASLTGRDATSGRQSAGTLSSAGIVLAGDDAKGKTSFALSIPAGKAMRWRSSSEDARESRSADVTLNR